jgi:PAT family acetyl-CoA transporter-like MFS transporter 1
VLGEEGASSLSLWFYARVLVVQLLYSLASNILFVSQCSFFARVCDSSIGGSYMTLLNTISNLGSSWPKFFVFAAVDLFSCNKESKPCGALAFGKTDGFYVVSAICFAYGVGWFLLMRKRMLQLGTIEKKHWSCE